MSKFVCVFKSLFFCQNASNSNLTFVSSTTQTEQITPANYATYLRYGLLIPKPAARVSGASNHTQNETPAQQQAEQPPTATQDQSPKPEQQMSPPLIRINPNTQTRNQSRLATALQPNQSEAEGNNNGSTTDLSATPTSGDLSTSTVTSNSSTFATSMVSNYLSNQHHHQQQQQMLALQLQRAAPPLQSKPDTPTTTNHVPSNAPITPNTRYNNNSNSSNNNNNHHPNDLTNTCSPAPADSTPTTPNTPTGGSRPPQRRRVRRKVNSPADDPAEQLTEMSVRGLDLFRYAKICEGIYQCTECLKENIQKTFKNKYSFQRHAFLYHEGSQRKVFPCPVCNKEFSRPDKMKNHMKTTHEGYVPRDAAYPLNFMIGGAGDLAMSLARFPKLSKAKLVKMEKLEALMMGPHFGSTAGVGKNDGRGEDLQQQQQLLGHRMVDMDDIDDDMELMDDITPDVTDEAVTAPLSTMQSKIDDVVQRIQLAQMEVQGARDSASPRLLDTIKVEDSEPASVSD